MLQFSKLQHKKILKTLTKKVSQLMTVNTLEKQSKKSMRREKHTNKRLTETKSSNYIQPKCMKANCSKI